MSTPSSNDNKGSLSGMPIVLGAVIVIGAIVMGVNLLGSEASNDDALQASVDVEEAIAFPHRPEQPPGGQSADRFFAGDFEWRVDEMWRQRSAQTLDTAAREANSTEGDYLVVVFVAEQRDEFITEKMIPLPRLIDEAGQIYEPIGPVGDGKASRFESSDNEEGVYNGRYVFHAPPGRGYDFKVNNVRVELEPKTDH